MPKHVPVLSSAGFQSHLVCLYCTLNDAVFHYFSIKYEKDHLQVYDNLAGLSFRILDNKCNDIASNFLFSPFGMAIFIIRSSIF